MAVSLVPKGECGTRTADHRKDTRKTMIVALARKLLIAVANGDNR
jgi:hypothetical protein